MYTLKKSIWTEDDFEQMCWHDCRIHAFSTNTAFKDDYFQCEIAFDIDYILKWVNNPKRISFWIAPSTLFFKEVTNFRIQWNSGSMMPELYVKDITQEEIVYKNGYKSWHWHIGLMNEGCIEFDGKGYEQIIRSKPVYSDGQSLSQDDRNGICFDRTPFA